MERVRALVEERENARADKNWERADTLRAEIEKKGFNMEDTAGVPRIFRKK